MQEKLPVAMHPEKLPVAMHPEKLPVAGSVGGWFYVCQSMQEKMSVVRVIMYVTLQQIFI